MKNGKNVKNKFFLIVNMFSAMFYLINLKRHLVNLTNQIININMTETKQQNKQKKKSRWEGYKVNIIKDSEDAMTELNNILSRKKIHHYMKANTW